MMTANEAQLESFLDRLKVRDIGISNFRTWFQDLNDCWYRSGNQVWHYFNKGQVYLDTIPTASRALVEQKVQYLYSEGVCRSIETAEKDDYFPLVGFTRDELLAKCEQLRTHTYQERASIWLDIIELFRDLKRYEAFRILNMANVSRIEFYCILRILYASKVYTMENIKEILTNMAMIHNTIKASWRPDCVEESFNFTYTTQEKADVPHIARGERKVF